MNQENEELAEEIKENIHKLAYSRQFFASDEVEEMMQGLFNLNIKFANESEDFIIKIDKRMKELETENKILKGLLYDKTKKQ